MAESVFFSVLIPVYNVEPYLRECLDSVLSQGWEKLELILVDDGSTDQSGAICDEYAKNDPRIQVVHKPNGGLMSARRAALERARGDYFLFADSDDRLLPGVFETLSEAINASGADCLIYGVSARMARRPPPCEEPGRALQSGDHRQACDFESHAQRQHL